jgi:hypothetical protein
VEEGTQVVLDDDLVLHLTKTVAQNLSGAGVLT